ncbi:MAG: hypothetical protein MUE50_20440, partial [Pirellulaceae bacterium]|nr:hypothetical protein [Pirellulaceae bacterium]
RHGDALHVSRFDPDHPDPIVFGIHENEGSRRDATTPAAAAFNARTGQTLWRVGDAEDAGYCLAADIDPRHAGAEMWGGPGGLRTCRGAALGPAPRSANFAVWWDGDLLRELLDRTTISTEHRIRTLMHDPQYRLSIAWQNVAYNQPPHTGFYLGEAMEPGAENSGR